jgi:hypothetical protein
MATAGWVPIEAALCSDFDIPDELCPLMKAVYLPHATTRL